MDATHIKASANQNKKLRQKVKHKAHVYARELRAEINAEREYRSKAKVCRACPCRMQCTQSKNAVKLLQRHIWQEFVDTAESIRKTPEGKALYKRRKETIEREIADAKVEHGMRHIQLRGLAKVNMR